MGSIPGVQNDTGQIDKERVSPNGSLVHTGKDESALALLQRINESDTSHPVHWPLWQKWAIIFPYCLLQVFVSTCSLLRTHNNLDLLTPECSTALSSTTYVSAEFLIQERYGSSTQVITLGQSMFIVGNAVRSSPHNFLSVSNG